MTQSEHYQRIKDRMDEARRLEAMTVRSEKAEQHREAAMKEVIEYVADEMTSATTYCARRMAKEILR